MLSMGGFWSPALKNGIGTDRTGPNNGPERTKQLLEKVVGGPFMAVRE